MAGDVEHHSPQARLLGAELRQLRTEAGFTVRALSAVIGLGPAAVSRYETGIRTPSEEILGRLLTALSIDSRRYDELMALGRRALGAHTAESRSGPRKHLLNIAAFERAADRIVHVAPLVVPGPLQTREYADEVMSIVSGDEREVRVELRMARGAAVLSGGRLEAIIAERVLTEGLGGSAVMRGQIRHLIDVARGGEVRVRLIPRGGQRWTLAHNGSFVLFEFEKAAPIVHLEHYRGPAFLYDQKDVEAYRKALVNMDGTALQPEESVELMEGIAEQWERSHAS